jgi:hypothetical protein
MSENESKDIPKTRQQKKRENFNQLKQNKADLRKTQKKKSKTRNNARKNKDVRQTN